MRSTVEAVAVVSPVRRHSVVYGIPDTEGNAVEVARHLVAEGEGRVTWLTESGEREEVAWALAGVPQASPLRVVRKRSLRGLAHFLTASRAFYTHALYFSPRPVRGRVYVNLWHGDGPKLVDTLRPRRPADSVVVAGTRLWGEIKAHALGLSTEQLLVVGNPRIDQFLRPADDQALERLGLDPTRPFVVWAPTFREARQGRLRWSDTELLSRTSVGREQRDAGWDAGQTGPQVVVKPHPLDSDDYGQYGLSVVDEQSLRRAGIGFYQLLARSAGLVTDYSSVWTDYLPLGRPIGFYCPDLEEYARARDLDLEQFTSLIAGPLLRSPAELADFCRTVSEGEDPGRSDRARVIERLGAVLELGATERLVAALGGIDGGSTPRTVS